MKSYKKPLCSAAVLASLLLMGTTNSYAKSSFVTNMLPFVDNGLSFVDIGTGVIENDGGKTVSLYGVGIRAGLGSSFSIGLDYKTSGNVRSSTVPPKRTQTTQGKSFLSTYSTPGVLTSNSKGRVNNVSTTIDTTEIFKSKQNKSLIGLKIYHPVKFNDKVTIASYIGASLFTDKIESKETEKNTSTKTITAAAHTISGKPPFSSYFAQKPLASSKSSASSTLTLKQKYLTLGMRFEAEYLYLDATLYTPIGKQSVNGKDPEVAIKAKRDPFVTFMIGAQF